jgi:cyclase
MTRAIVLSTFVVTGAFLAAAARSEGQAPDASSVRMQSMDTGDFLYTLIGGGSNSLALIRPEGVVLIDTKRPGLGRPLADAIASVSESPVTTIINTSADADHTGSNAEFPRANQIIAHANSRKAMEKMDAFKGVKAKFLPNKIVSDRLTLLEGVDQIDVYYFGRGHTDGDLVVVFPNKEATFAGPSAVAYFGDLFPRKAAPVIDVAHGGSGVAFPETLAKAVAALKGRNVQRVVTGHDSMILPPEVRFRIYAKTMTWNELEEYADFNRDFLAAVQRAIAAGKSATEAAETLQLPDRYKGYDMTQAKANVEKIYRELGK